MRFSLSATLGWIALASAAAGGGIEEWQALPFGGGSIVRGIAVDPTDPRHLISANGFIGETLIQSFNGGESWVNVMDIPSLGLLPAGFFLGGLYIYSGDPGLGIALVPAGGLLLFVAVALTARMSRQG